MTTDYKETILSMIDENLDGRLKGYLDGRELYKLFSEAAKDEIKKAARELQQEDKITIFGNPNREPLGIFQCGFMRTIS